MRVTSVFWMSEWMRSMMCHAHSRRWTRPGEHAGDSRTDPTTTIGPDAMHTLAVALTSTTAAWSGCWTALPQSAPARADVRLSGLSDSTDAFFKQSAEAALSQLAATDPAVFGVEEDLISVPTPNGITEQVPVKRFVDADVGMTFPLNDVSDRLYASNGACSHSQAFLAHTKLAIPAAVLQRSFAPSLVLQARGQPIFRSRHKPSGAKTRTTTTTFI